MNVCQFNKILYKGNINWDFYWFCLKKDKKLIRFLFINLWYYILSYLFISKKNLFIKKQYNYLKTVANLDEMLSEFCKRNKISNYFNVDADVIIDRIPIIFIEKYFKNVKIIGYELDKNYDVKLEKFNNSIDNIDCVDYLYLNNKYLYSSIKCKFLFIIKNNFCKYIPCRRKVNNKIIHMFS